MSMRGRIVGVLAALLLAVSAGRGEEAQRVPRVYQVADLVIVAEATIPDHHSRSSISSAGSRRVTSEDRLIRQITDTIVPHSWAGKGGKGTIDFHPLTMALVVNQTAEIQEQIAGLLAALRRQREVEVSCEVKFVEVAGDALRKLKEQGMLGEPGKSRDGRSVALLDNDGLARLMEAVQQDVRSSVMQAPKLTTLNGQNSGVRIVEDQTFVTGLNIAWRDDRIVYEAKSEVVPLGIQMGLRPVVSADRRSIRLRFDLKWNDLISSEVPVYPITSPAPQQTTSAPREEKDSNAQPRLLIHHIQQPRINTMSLHRTLTIPSGRTAVLTGLVHISERECKREVPILSKLPGLGNLFCCTERRCEARDVLVLVTPTVLVPEETEEKKPAATKRCLPKGSGKCGVCDDFRTPILPPDFDVSHSNADAPGEARVLRSLAPAVSIPGVCEVSRDNIQIVTERVSEKTESPRFYPLVGPARLHHSHWKCTVYYNETIRGSYPFPFEWSQIRSEDVYLDCDCLQLVSADSPK